MLLKIKQAQCKGTVRMAGLLTIFLFTSLAITFLIYRGATTEFEAGEGRTWKFGMAQSHGHSAENFTFPTDLDDVPIIVWWTERLYPHINDFEKKSCPKSTCYATNKREYLKHPQTNAFYFYGTEFSPEDLPLPREKRHLWALAHEESPLNNFVLDHAVGMNVFNYTAAMQRDSDFPISTLSFPGPEFILNRQPISTEMKNMFQQTEGLAPVVYVQSHCEVPSDRDRYVTKLMEYIKVDSYGKCLHNKDLPLELVNPVENMFHTKFKEVIAKYKFILSFENGFCNDYMTEKLFRPLHVGSIPVYRGSPFARDFMPDNHSIIMTDDFESPKELAEFLLKLNSDDEKYEEYLQFKKKKKITNPDLQHHLSKRMWPFTNDDNDYGPFFEDFECYLCDKATERYENEKKHKQDPSTPLLPPKITDGRKFACPQPAPFSKPEQLDWWFIYNYEEQYWQGLDRARAMRDMINAGETDSKNLEKYLQKYGKKSKK